MIRIKQLNFSYLWKCDYIPIRSNSYNMRFNNLLYNAITEYKLFDEYLPNIRKNHILINQSSPFYIFYTLLFSLSLFRFF